MVMAKRRPAQAQASKHAAVAEADWAFRADDGAVFDALAGARHVDCLREYFGASAHAELAVMAAAAKKAKSRGGPRVLILPGIMGSRLGRTDRGARSEVLWIDPLRIGAGRMTELMLPERQALQSNGVLLFSYAKLKLKLQLDGCNADFFPYDWRLGLDELGTALAARIAADRKPVTLIAHSMGGLVARMAAAKLAKRYVRKLIMLGTPNGGSFAPVQALRGTYPFVRKLATLDRKHSAEYLAEAVFGTFPGLYHLLPMPRRLDGIDLLDPRCWPADGPAPNPQLLAQVAAARKGLPRPDSRMIQIVGVNQETVVGVRRTAAGFEYALGMNGDGTVPLASALLPKLKTYFVEELHGNLANNPQVIQAAIDLVRRGRTQELPQRWNRRRGPLRSIDDVRLRMDDRGKIDWRRLNSAQREAALAELDSGRSQSPGSSPPD
jgi:pimeloyl-ACP methyl ester carboxylesterase